MMHRLREAMADLSLLGGEGKIVEADTTSVGGKEKNKRDGKKIGGMGKQIVHTFVTRSGKVRSHHIGSISGKTLRPILSAHASRKSKQ